MREALGGPLVEPPRAGLLGRGRRATTCGACGERRKAHTVRSHPAMAWKARGRQVCFTWRPSLLSGVVLTPLLSMIAI